jgi:16S rRNA (guanine(527)-N(7))-methyltransferase RsmG
MHDAQTPGGSTADDGGDESRAFDERVERLVEHCARIGAPILHEPHARAAVVLAFLDAMLEENRKVNLTAIRDRERADVLHALDSCAFGKTGIAPRDVLDIGTGNGFPGAALAALHPTTPVTLIDRTGKKIAAVKRALAAASLDYVEARQLDAAQAPALERTWRRRFDVITSRATAPVEQLGRWAEPLLAPSGRLVLWLSANADAPPIAGDRRIELERVLDYELPPLGATDAPPTESDADRAARRRRLAIYHRG